MFKRLKKLEVAQATVWMDELPPEYGKKARLLLKPATEENKMYYNALLRLAGKRIRRSGRAADVDAAMLSDNREDDRELYPKYVIEHWEGILDDDGNEVPYSREAAEELCEQTPNWVFDRIRAWASSPERFINRDEQVPDLEEVSKNSENVSAMS